MEFLIGIIGIVVSVILYFAGVREGRRQERGRRQHEMHMAREQQKHELTLETERHHRELISKVADEYVSMSRRRRDNGPHALSSIGLEHLGSDRAIRAAIDEMRVRAGEDPWAGQSQHIQDIDLVAFFRHVREKGVNFFHTAVETVAAKMRAEGHFKPAENHATEHLESN